MILSRVIVVFLVITWCHLQQGVFAQGSIESLRQANKNIRVPVSLILGTWVSNDSLQREIEFVDKGGYVDIEPANLIHPYSFRKVTDSVSVTGCAMNWPPYDCILNLVDSSTMELWYFTYHSTQPYTVSYIRK